MVDHISRILCVGLTGGIGAGKSTAAQKFSELGATVIDADQIAHDCLRPNTPSWHAIVEHFSENILTNQQIDRHKLRQICLNNKAEKTWLESYLHPLIYQKIQSEIDNTTSGYCLVEIPLLFETNCPINFHRTCVVDAKVSQQITRVSARNQWPDSQIHQMMQNQLSRSQRLYQSDDVLDNSRTRQELFEQIQKLHLFYLDLCPNISWQNQAILN